MKKIISRDQIKVGMYIVENPRSVRQNVSEVLKILDEVPKHPALGYPPYVLVDYPYNSPQSLSFNYLREYCWIFHKETHPEYFL